MEDEMPLFCIYNKVDQYIGSYAKPTPSEALRQAERDCIEGGSRWIGGYAKLVADVSGYEKEV